MSDTRCRNASMSSVPWARSPMVGARVSSASSPPVAMSVLEGMQSQRWAAPPMTSRSTSVTSAPSDAATVAQVFPAGPAPMITRRVAGTLPGYVGGLDMPGTWARTLRAVPELRHDSLTGELVIVAPDRAARPHTATARHDPTVDADACPFCPGHEADTPPEVARVGAGEPNRPGWRVRAFANRYPVVGGPDAGPGATGDHEVVVLSPAHDRSLGAFDDDDAVEAIGMLRDRSRALADAGHADVQVVVNEGREAGASIAHPHAQLLALDFVPPAVAAALTRFAERDRVLEDHVAATAAGGLVLSRAGTAAWCAPGSSAAFEVRVAVLGAGPRFSAATNTEVGDVALALRDTLRRVGAVLDDPPYNMVVYDAPTLGGAPYHWWVRVSPRIEVTAGFELGTGVLIETVDPRSAAARLRDAAG